jgi:hypothetical protein
MRINIYGGPGIGKSTTAAWLFSRLKEEDYTVELVTEYIKSWAWEGRVPSSYDQNYIFAKQLRREDILTRKGVHLISDSPLPLQLVYAKKYNCPFYPELFSLCKKFDAQHPSLNVLLARTKAYQTQGRFETFEEAQDVDKRVVDLLREYDAKYIRIDPRQKDTLLEIVKDNLNEVRNNDLTE